MLLMSEKYLYRPMKTGTLSLKNELESPKMTRRNISVPLAIEPDFFKNKSPKNVGIKTQKYHRWNDVVQRSAREQLSEHV